jgi:4-hydroxy-2-oxoheptanedioate aldolase
VRRNQAKTKLRNGESIFGVIAPNADPVDAEIVGYIGFDFYMMDGEHGSIGPQEALGIVRACEAVGITPLARVRSNDPKLVLQFLDSGVMGIMMPGLLTPEDVDAFVNSVKYPPIGTRGLGPIRAADYMLGHMTQAEYVTFANDQTLVLPQFEDADAIELLPEMAKVNGVDGFVIGPRDLAMSMGYIDGPNHPEVQEVIDRAVEFVLEAGLYLGMVAGTGEAARGVQERGARICLNSVAGLLRASGRLFLEQARI